MQGGARRKKQNFPGFISFQVGLFHVFWLEILDFSLSFVYNGQNKNFFQGGSMRVLIFLLLAFLSAPFCAYAGILEEFMPITIDGDLNDLAWGRAPKVEPEKGVVCWTLVSKGQLCVAVQNRRLDGAPPTARAVPQEGQNSPAFIDDCVEIQVSVCGDDASSVVKSVFLNARGAIWQDAEPDENARIPWKNAKTNQKTRFAAE